MAEPKDILHWLQTAYAVSSVRRGEVNFPCPKCEHEAFYFNINKKVGMCHRASCHWTPKLKDIIDILGYGPEDAGWVPQVVTKKEIKEVKLPEYINRVSFDVEARDALISRGLSPDDMVDFNIHSDRDYIYIPVTYNNKLVQYIGRRIDRENKENPWKLPKELERYRYRYATGSHITNYLWNWDCFSKRTELVLVENTFNAIIYKFCSNFGSHLSDRQVQLIRLSRVMKVSLIWDEGSGEKAEKAVEKLRQAGVSANYVVIEKQPDNHSKDVILNIAQEALRNNTKRLELAYYQRS